MPQHALIPIAIPDSVLYLYLLRGDLCLHSQNYCHKLLYTRSNGPSQPPRPQGAGASRVRDVEPAPGEGRRSLVCAERFLRCARRDASQVRDAEEGAGRWRAYRIDGYRLWLLETVILPGAGRIPRRGTASLDAAQTWTAWCTQAESRCDAFYQRGSCQGRKLGEQCAGGNGEGALRNRSPRAEHRACPRTRKKNSTAQARPVAPVSSQSLSQEYERLRAVVVDGQREPGCLGLALLARQGVAAWISAWETLNPSVPRCGEPGTQAEYLVDDLRAEVAVVLAEMALSAVKGAA